MKHQLTRRALLASSAAVVPAFNVFGQSATFPSKPVRIVFPFPPGTANDVAVRMVAERLSAKWKQPVLVDSKPGASTIIGTDMVVRAPADGHTLLANITLVLQNTALGRKLPYNVQTDLRPIAQIHRSQLSVLSRTDFPAKNLTEMFALAKRSTEMKFNFASWGLGSTAHIVYEKMRVDQKIDYTHVPYKGGSEIITGLLVGDVQVGMADLLSPAPHIKSGKIKVIGVTGPRRRPEYPNAPTLAESGVTGFEGYNWLGLFAPAALDTRIAMQINEAVAEALSDPVLVKRFTDDLIVEPARLSLNEWTQTVERDLTSWRAVVQRAKVTVDN